MRSVRTLLVTSLIATLVATSATQASAQTVDTLPCPATTPDADFSDVHSANTHKRGIDCIAHWGITTQAGTYGPSQPVTRWQMALFLTRTAALAQALPDGTPSGFSDIGALTPEAQLAVYELAELSITAGTSPTTYGPEAAVTREQMAVFLVRTVRAVGVTLPDGSTQGFTDIAALGAESQAAINQVRQLGITFGTSATTFSPSTLVTREQMASFLARTLNVIWTVSFFDTTNLLVCTVPPSGPIDCVASGRYPAGRTFTIREGFQSDLPVPSSALDPALGRFELYLDGAPVAATEKTTALSGYLSHTWEATFIGGLTGTHQLVGRWYYDGVLGFTVSLSAQFM